MKKKSQEKKKAARLNAGFILDRNVGLDWTGEPSLGCLGELLAGPE